MAKKEIKGEVELALDKLIGEKSGLFEKGKKRGVVMVFYDMEGQGDMTTIGAHVTGDFGTLVAAITKTMERNDKFRDVLREANSFYRFKNNPMDGILDAIMNKMDDVLNENKLKSVQTQDAEAREVN